MSKYVGKQTTPRHHIPYDHEPTKKAHVYGGSIDSYPVHGDYGSVLDCVLDMVDKVATSNGISLEKAMSQVLNDELWSVLPSHQALIIAMLKDEQYG